MWRIQKCQPDFLPNAAASEAPTLIRHCNSCSIGPRRGIFRDVGHIVSVCPFSFIYYVSICLSVLSCVIYCYLSVVFMGHAAWVKINEWMNEWMNSRLGLFVESRRFWPTPRAFGAPQGVIPDEFRGDLWHQKTRVPGLSCGVVCVILSLVVLVENWLVTDGQPERRLNPWCLELHAFGVSGSPLAVCPLKLFLPPPLLVRLWRWPVHVSQF